ncbi:MAG: permease-like cell division protein FtsX, partial [Actinomycetia bacterium]|nr:permease-like cell division protein FtsX [Actinomycetes bacterium]
MYFIKEALSSFRKNIVQSIAAVTTVGLCLVVIGLILMVMYVGGEIIEGIEKKVEIEIFFDNPETIQSSGRVTARMDKIQEIENTVRAWSEVSKVRYVSKEQALDKFKKDFQYNPEVIQNIEGNPLPDSLR